MILPTSTTTSAVASAAACVLACALRGCAAPSKATADSPSTLRVIVQLTRASEDGKAIAAEATMIAGVPVTYAAATSPTWHALALHCAGAACDAAIARLRAAPTFYRAVEIGGRKTPAS